MRTHLLRTALMTCLALLTLGIAPAFAQSVVRGKVVDAKDQPVADATIVFEAQGANRRLETKTNKNGEFLQLGLQSGMYKVTASKDGVGSEALPVQVSINPGAPVNFKLGVAPPAGAGGGVDSAALQTAAAAALEALKAGRNDEAIAKLNEVVAKVPKCADCYYNLGVAYANKQQYTEAENAFKQVLLLKPDSPEAYGGLANVYNAQKKFDLAAEASAKAGAAGTAGVAGGGASAEFNQGVILFNAGKFADAKPHFEAATKADPTMAMAHYQLGMTALNLGQFAEAVGALETYLKVDPNGPRAAEVKAALPALQGMVKK